MIKIQKYADAEILQKISDAYNAEGGYLSGSYLIKPSAEDDTQFSARQKLSAWTDDFKNCVDSNVNPLFATQPDRLQFPQNPYLDLFLFDCDNTGTPYTLFIESLCLDLKLYGTMLVVIDNFSDLSMSQGDNLAQRKLPYIYSVRPDNLSSVVCDDFGRLASVAFKVKYSTTNAKGEIVEKDGHRYFDATQSILYAQNGKDVVEQKPITLGRIPCFLAYAGRHNIKKSKIMSSPVATWWKTADMCFQMLSECRVLQRKSAFSQISIQGRLTENKQSVGDSIIQYDINAKNAPQWIQPNVDALIAIEDSRNTKLKDLYRMAGIDYKGSGSGESGIALKMAWEFAKISFEALKEAMTRTESQIIYLFGLWIGQDWKDVRPIYSGTLGIDNTTERIDDSSKFNSYAGEIPSVKKYLVQESLKVYLPNITQEELTKIGDEASAVASQNLIDVANASPTPPQPTGV